MCLLGGGRRRGRVRTAGAALDYPDRLATILESHRGRRVGDGAVRFRGAKAVARRFLGRLW